MRAPEEVFASEAAGAPQAEDELSREDRKRRRAQVRLGGPSSSAVGVAHERDARAL